MQVFTIISKGMLTGQATALTLGLVAAMAGWSLVESFAEKNWIGLTVSGACLIIVTKIKTRPKIIQAETERIAMEAKMREAVTITKHAMTGQLYAAEMHLRLRGELLRQHNIEFDLYQPIDFRVLTKHEDKNRAKIVGLDFNELNEEDLVLPPI